MGKKIKLTDSETNELSKYQLDINISMAKRDAFCKGLVIAKKLTGNWNINLATQELEEIEPKVN